MTKPLIIAIPKGRILDEALPLLARVGIEPEADFHDKHSRARSEEHTSELQSLMRISYAVFCLKKKTKKHTIKQHYNTITTTYNKRQYKNYSEKMNAMCHR